LVIDVNLSQVDLTENPVFDDDFAFKLIEKGLCDVIEIGASSILGIVGEPNNLCSQRD